METFYKVTLYDDVDIELNRNVLNTLKKEAILSTRFKDENELNNKLTSFINKYECPFLLTEMQVSEYILNEESHEEELIGFVSFSELNERLKLTR